MQMATKSSKKQEYKLKKRIGKYFGDRLNYNTMYPVYN